MTFTLDTSGAIRLVPAASDPDGPLYRWSDLDPFTQGYVEALFSSAPYGDGRFMFPLGTVLTCGFHHLAPETLQRIVTDCAAHLKASTDLEDGPFDDEPRGRIDLRHLGAAWWRGRQLGNWAGQGFPPLTPYLGEDAKVYLREDANQIRLRGE